MSETEWILGRVREALPPRLQTIWRFGLTIIFAVGALLFLALKQHVPADYVRIFGWAMAVYIIVIAARIAQVNYGIRRQLVRLGKNSTDDLKTAKMMPTHIILLALGTIGSVTLFSALMAVLYGQPSVFPALPWLIDLVFFIKVLGLNLVWRFVEIRRAEND